VFRSNSRRGPVGAPAGLSNLRTRSAPITYAVRRAFPCSGCWTTGTGPVAGSTVRAPEEDDGEERGYAEREECPDEEEGSAGLGDRAADSRPLHVDDGDARPEERPEEDDDVPRSPFGEHQRSVQPDDQDGHRNEV